MYNFTLQNWNFGPTWIVTNFFANFCLFWASSVGSRLLSGQDTFIGQLQQWLSRVSVWYTISWLFLLNVETLLMRNLSTRTLHRVGHAFIWSVLLSETTLLNFYSSSLALSQSNNKSLWLLIVPGSTSGKIQLPKAKTISISFCTCGNQDWEQ